MRARALLGWVLLFVSLIAAADALAGYHKRRGYGRSRPLAAVERGGSGVDLANVYALDFNNGAAAVAELADDAALEPSTSLSGFLRFRQNGQTATDTLISKRNAAGTQNSFHIDHESASGGYIRFRLLLCAVVNCSTNYALASQRGAAETNVWTSLAWTVDWVNDEAHLFVDGAEVGVTVTGSFPADWVDSTANWAIGGRDSGDGTVEWDGQMDDVMLWPDVELTPSCVMELHNKRGSRTVPSCAGTPATWCRGGDDDGGTGTTCTDHTDQGRDWLLGTGATFQNTSVPAKLTLAVADTGNLTRQVILFLGQSNLSGRGDVGDIADQSVEFPNRGNVFNYDNDGAIGTPNGTTNPAVEPIDSITGQAAVFPASDEASEPGVSPMLAAADYIAGVWTNHEIGIVPCPLGGTSALEWGTSHGQVTRLFGECESRWQDANLGSGTAEVAAIVVYQGENDAQEAFEAESWAYRWQAIIEGVRDDLGERDIPAIVVVLPATVPSAGDYSEWATVRAQQQSICDYLDHCSTVQAPSGPYTDTDLHLDTSAALTLGDLIGAAILATDYAGAVTP